MKRGGTPTDVASLVSYLASDNSSFVTGEHLFLKADPDLMPRHQDKP
jgi:NAD(P)-dependent dehydrogenase (short-subunit alcohol dehydrogenase family)